MIKVAVIDDIPEHLSAIQRVTEEFFQKNKKEAEITLFPTLGKYLEQKHRKFNIYLFDIALRNIRINGVDAAINTTSNVKDAQIIFLSSYDQYFLDVYRIEHVYFIPKQRMHDLLPEALKRAVHHLEKDKVPIIPIRFNKELYLVREDLVRYMEKTLRKVIIYGEETYECYAKFEEILAFSKTGQLIQCHKSYVVNTVWIRSLDRNGCVLFDGTVIPVSRTYYRALVNKLAEDIGEKPGFGNETETK